MCDIETKRCNKCGRVLPVENFRLMRGQFNNPYYLGQCKECEYKYRRDYLEKKNEIQFSSNIEIILDRRYKEINPERILDISDINIAPVAADEIFLNLMDYKNTWLSNYGRVIRYVKKKYYLLKGSCDVYGALHYTLPKNIYRNGRWIYKRTVVYAAKAVVEEFVVNPDVANNIFIWHRGYNKRDYYYKNLYPLNREQYRIVKNHFNKTGDDSEDFIIKVMNDIKFKPNDWSSRSMRPIMCGIGFRGSEDIDAKSESYLRWHDMMNRCYNEKFHEKQPQYKDCSVCEEWLNYSNFKVWFDKNKIPGIPMDLDKDILFKGNKVYSPDTVVFVPHFINTLFINAKKNRGDLPVGISFDKERNKYRAEMTFLGKNIKLGRFDSAEDAFSRYKQYKEDFIKDMAELHRKKIPDKVYDAMMQWEIDIND